MPSREEDQGDRKQLLAPNERYYLYPFSNLSVHDAFKVMGNRAGEADAGEGRATRNFTKTG
jgi:hypothetical protein